MKPTNYKSNHRISDSELILNADGSVYHLQLLGHQIADTIIIVGDPDRVELISSRFDSVEFRKRVREFCTHTGSLNGKRITVVSSGIGVDNIDILINELHAAINIDPESRLMREEARSLQIVRIGTCGTMQSDIPVGSYVASVFALGTDGVPWHYEAEMTEEEEEMAQAFKSHCDWPTRFADPYCSAGTPELIELFDFALKGVTLTLNGFYAPQQRQVNIPLAHPELLERYQNFAHSGLRMTNFEMECAGIYALSTMLGHKCATVCAILANRALGQFSDDPLAVVDNLIGLILSRLTR